VSALSLYWPSVGFGLQNLFVEDTAMEYHVGNKESNYFIIKLVSNRPFRGPVF